MAEEQLNLNAKPFIDSLNLAIEKIREFRGEVGLLPGRLQGQAKAATAAGKAHGNLGKAVHNNAEAQQSVSKAVAGTNKVFGEQQVQIVGITLRYKELFKLVMARVITLMFHQLQSNARRSIQDMRDLEVALLELQTIAGEMEAGADGIAMMHRQVSELSRQFGIARLDIVDAQYQALSASIGNSTREIETFTREIIRFSKVTATQLPDAVGLAASVLNSFNMSVLETNRVMSVMFAMIREGRLRAEEVAHTMGRVTASANALGIGFEEVAATLAIMTRSGVQAREAMTSLNAIMQQFIQPSEELIEVFNRWGVTSGEAAVATFGFTGIMERFGQIVREDGIQALGDLVTQQRGLRGILLAMRPELQELTEAYQDATRQAEEYGDVIEQRLNAPAEEFDRQIQRIRMGFDSVGQAALASVDWLSRWGLELSTSLGILVRWGGVLVATIGATHAYQAAIKLATLFTARYNSALAATVAKQKNLVLHFRTSTGALKAHTVGLKIATTSTTALTKATVGLKVALGGVLAVLKSPAFFALAPIGAYTFYMRRLRREEERYLEVLKERAETQERILGQVIALRRQAYEEHIQGVLQDNAESLAAANKKLEAADTLWLNLELSVEEYNKHLAESLKHTEAWIDELEEVRDRYRDIANEARRSLEDLRMDYLFEDFERQLRRMDPLQQLEARFGFASRLVQRAGEAFSEGDAEAMRDAFSSAHGLLQDFDRQAHEIGFIPAIIESERAFHQLFQTRKSAEMEIIAAAEREVTLRDQELQHQKNLAQQIRNQKHAQEEILDLAEKIFEVTKSTELSDGQKAIYLDHYRGQMADVLGQKQADWNLTNQILGLEQERLNAVRTRMFLEEQEADLRAKNMILEEMRESEDRITEIYAERGKFLSNDILPQVREIESILARTVSAQRMTRHGPMFLDRTPEGLGEAREILQQLTPLIQQAESEMQSLDGQITQETTESLGQLLEDFKALPEEVIQRVHEDTFQALVLAGKELLATTKEEEEVRERIAGQQEAISGIQQQMSDRGEEITRLQALENAYEGINVEVEKTRHSLGDIPDLMEDTNRKVRAALNPIARMAQEFTNAADAVERLGVMTSNIDRLNLGGPFAPGFAKGGSIVDNTPAMLSKGEEVIRSGPAAAYRSTLKDMNVSNRMMPVSQQRGLSSSSNTTNATINVTDSGSPQLTSKQVMYHLSRAQQRGIA